jgi:hypothetical protein
MNELREATAVHTGAARCVTCHRCGAHYEASEWQRLPIYRRVGACELRSLVLNWSERLWIDELDGTTFFSKSARISSRDATARRSGSNRTARKLSGVYLSWLRCSMTTKTAAVALASVSTYSCHFSTLVSRSE